jgi:ABC-2 type transport system permease protein
LQPATHAVNAFNRIFLYGAGLGDILYELTMLVFISFIFFLTGLWFWKKGIALST